IVKEQVRRGFQLTVARWRILRFPLFESSLYFRFPHRLLNEAFLTRRPVCRCSVSVVAHYRELLEPDKT
ncbi:hypothetical protein, partial [Salmonella enterica]|uniref:hypothetical protein n=1 Tax=Salmonella enterica TaxID=28901 RepID=UPI001BB0A054